MKVAQPLSLDILLDLAPTHLHSYRASRYLGDDITVSFGQFHEIDQHLIQKLYQTLQELLATVRAHLDEPAVCFNQLRAFMERVRWVPFVQGMQRFGEASYSQSSDDILRKVIHDVRGGGFQALSIQLQFIEMNIAQSEDVWRLFFLVRDHLKIMRNAILDIDPPGYERDRCDNMHNVRLLTEKWQQAVYKLRDRSATVMVECQFDGNVSERCLEFAALDRVLYNLMNNAVRNTSDELVYLAILPLPEEPPIDLRFVIYNHIGDEQRQVLQERYGSELGNLFRGGFTTGGTGLGMRICGDFVTNAYGVYPLDEGVKKGYIGATLIDNFFVNWFHWPIAAD